MRGGITLRGNGQVFSFHLTKDTRCSHIPFGISIFCSNPLQIPWLISVILIHPLLSLFLVHRLAFFILFPTFHSLLLLSTVAHMCGSSCASEHAQVKKEFSNARKRSQRPYYMNTNPVRAMGIKTLQAGKTVTPSPTQHFSVSITTVRCMMRTLL